MRNVVIYRHTFCANAKMATKAMEKSYVQVKISTKTELFIFSNIKKYCVIYYLIKCSPLLVFNFLIMRLDIDECLKPEACGVNARCINTPGNYTCACPEGFYGSPYDGCYDVDECTHPDACGPGAICVNLEGSYRCDCPVGYEGDARSLAGCVDFDECARSPCGRNAQCSNTEGSFKCICPDGYSGDPNHNCEGKLQKLCYILLTC